MNNDPQVFYLCYNLKIFIENMVISIIIVNQSKVLLNFLHCDIFRILILLGLSPFK